jgi:hypothetical protein
MIEIVSGKWLLVWLKGRNNNNLLTVSNATTLTVGFVERDKSNGVVFRLSELRNPQIAKLYNKIAKKQKDNILSPMQKHWVSYAIS